MNGPPESDQAGATGQDDDFVGRLGDRLSQEHQLPPEPIAPSGHVTEASDVHKLPKGGFDDDAIEVPPAPTARDSHLAFADFEEVEGEATRIDDSHLLAEASTSILETAPVQPFLAVERGKDMGRDFVLQQGENGVGRGIDNDVILADVSVSRRHLRIIRAGDELKLKDLGSGNGTLLNGQKVSMAALVDGDRIELGETTLVVRMPGSPLAADQPYEATDENHIGPPSAAMTPSDPFALPHGPGYHPELTPSNTAAPVPAVPSKGVVLPKPLLISFGAAAALLIVALLITIGVLALGGDADDPVEPTVTIGSSHFEQGVRAYNAQNWQEAQTEFTVAARENGTDRRVQDYLERTGRAITDADGLNRARSLRSQADLTGAFDAASAVSNTDSPLFHDAQRLQTEIRTEQARLAVTQGQTELEAGHLEEARNQLELAREMNAQPSVVRDLELAIARASGEATADPVEGPGESGDEPGEEPAGRSGAEHTQGSGRTSGSSTRPGRVRPPRPIPTSVGRSPRGGGASDSLTTRIVAGYLAGNFESAANMARIGADAATGADARRLRSLHTNIQSFGGLWVQITRANFGAGVRRQMSSALALDRQIANNPHYRNRLLGPLVQIHLAEADRQRGNVVAACQSIQAAYRINSTNPDVRRRSGDCEINARGMLLAAQTAPRARAQEIYSNVLQMVPSTSPMANDARTRAQALRRSSAAPDEDE